MGVPTDEGLQSCSDRKTEDTDEQTGPDNTASNLWRVGTVVGVQQKMGALARGRNDTERTGQGSSPVLSLVR